jgi:ribosomal subunit interface protein
MLTIVQGPSRGQSFNRGCDMTFRVSGQNMDVGDALRERITSRLKDALSKYFDGTSSGHATVRREGGFFSTECILHLSTGTTMHSEGRSADAYSSADEAANHLEKRLRRYKRRLKDHRASERVPEPAPATAYVLEAPDLDDATEEAGTTEYHPVIIAESATNLKRMSVGEAVVELDLLGAPVVVFRHAGHGRVAVVYRRPDGNIGWIDPAPVVS